MFEDEKEDDEKARLSYIISGAIWLLVSLALFGADTETAMGLFALFYLLVIPVLIYIFWLMAKAVFYSIFTEVRIGYHVFLSVVTLLYMAVVSNEIFFRFKPLLIEKEEFVLLTICYSLLCIGVLFVPKKQETSGY